MTVAEVMAHLKVSRSTVYTWMREKHLPYRELPSGGGRRFRRADVDRLLAEPSADADGQDSDAPGQSS